MRRLPPAGVQAAKLEDLERRLRGDMLLEAQRWGGKLLLHRELPRPAAVPLRALEGPAAGAGAAGAGRRQGRHGKQL